MPNILIVHSDDAAPYLASFASALAEWPLRFINIGPQRSVRGIRSRLARADVCLILSSSILRDATAPRRLRYQLAMLRHWLKPQSMMFEINVDKPSEAHHQVWREVVSAEQDPVFRGRPIAEMRPGEFEFLLENFAEFLRTVLWTHRSDDRKSLLIQKFETSFFLSERVVARLLTHDPRSVELLFATNRMPAEGPEVTDFTGERAEQLSFGSTRVRVPEDHKIGRLELPKTSSWIRLRFSDEKEDPKLHFVLESISVFDQSRFVSIIESDPTHTAIVFVHGFNTSFKEGVLRFAQIVWDMQFGGVPVLFSWPSRGGVLNYLYDINSALNTRELFGQLIQLLRAQAKVKTLHIVAHSMGNFVVLEALNGLAKAGTIPTLSEIVMAAPDVDIDLFTTLTKNIRPAAHGMTLYASSNDKALVVSRGAAKKPRAGDVFSDGPIVLEHFDSIDVSAIGHEMFGLNHDVFASNRSLVDDIGRLLGSSTRPPDQRSPQIRCVPEGAKPPRYWRYPG